MQWAFKAMEPVVVKSEDWTSRFVNNSVEIHWIASSGIFGSGASSVSSMKNRAAEGFRPTVAVKNLARITKRAVREGAVGFETSVLLREVPPSNHS